MMLRSTVGGVRGGCSRQLTLRPRRKMTTTSTRATTALSTRTWILIGTTATAGSIILYSSYRSRSPQVLKYYSTLSTSFDQSIRSTIPRLKTHASNYLGQGNPIRNDSAKEFPNSTRNVHTSDEPQTESKSEKKNENSDSYFSNLSGLGDRVTNIIVPAWAQSIPQFVDKLQDELKFEEGTVANDIWQEAHDPSVHPEIARSATVRVSSDLCDEEKAFLKQRKLRTTKALAQYLDLPPDEIHPDDVPTIAMCGSGGGLRALVAGSASYLSAQEAGLFDCVTYTAGVSGSTWLQTLYYSTLSGQRHDGIIKHLKHRIHVHIAFPPPLMALLTSAPTRKFLLSGPLEKYRGMNHVDFGLVDVYGILLGARLLIPKGDLEMNDLDLKLSNQRRFVDNGEHPLPIYASVRHEIPNEDSLEGASEAAKEKAKQESWFQWYETTPYEFACEEVGAGIPTWAMGRQFQGGESVPMDEGTNLPEMRVPLLMGVWGSAFCATLSHYYKEIRPVIKGLSGFSGLDKLIEERNDDLYKVHPVDPSSFPNFAYDMKDSLPDSTPKNLYEKEDIKLMDAGMSNNLPIYPLLRPGREVDVLIAFDASADIKEENWLRVADGYAKQRGIKGWPIGTGWPDGQASDEKQTGKALDDAETKSVKSAESTVNEAKQEQNETKENGTDHSNTSKSGELGYCNIWVGTTQQRDSDHEPPQSKQVEEDWQLMTPDAGIAVVYFPFLANPKVEGVDPQTSEFMSTWNFVYTPEQVDKVVELARANFSEGKERVKGTVRAVYERKKKQRLEREKKDKDEQKKSWWRSATG